MGKINVCDKILIENQKNRKYDNQGNLHKSASKRLFRNGIYNLLRQADTRASAVIIYCL